ncbi:polyhydroxyalkanoate synthase [Novosphingobium chloroacetimidivorans]|uniref:Polyhydroxyalkanoate synthase n=1 Tax=Novosphingobium chloroacetimidivorans TaxID=1428314 RepID=A0A7W7K8P6_9SPHN|nr:alpha/beta fold hydrolase [Novosphingobium chloroacetimidivorans]MBB4857578.1 polyhydroxyalkanoate synthase [Novosphingobium chloroacetimidivorans]
MPTQAGPFDASMNLFGELMMAQAQGALALFGQMLPQAQPAQLADSSRTAAPSGDAAKWAEAAARLQALWTDFQVEQLARASAASPQLMDPTRWMEGAGTVLRQLPLANPEVQGKLWDDGLTLATAILGQFDLGSGKAQSPAELPRQDPRFADPSWRKQPFFALVHQLYLMVSEQVIGMAEGVEGLDAARKRQLVFATRAFVDGLSPANFPLTNPVALEKAIETRGESLVKGMEHLLSDLRRGQLTHTPAEAFKLGETIAATPGKVVHETPLFQLIQYSPTTDTVLATPLVIFPPWINRFYILDLNARKSFVRWAVEQGVTVFMVSWKSADASMADHVWDHYIAAQIEAVDVVRARLGVPSVHTIGYCVAGTTLAATLAILARNGEAEKVASATFFTAQVDFEDAGDLKNFVDDQQIEALGHLSPEGYVDGRYLAAAFNLLRGNDLIWSYVEKNYLRGEEHMPFDLLHWNGDVTNLPARWHRDYLRDLYRDNRLVVPDSLSACGVPIDLRRITTPCYIQAGREDHIAPPASVWKLTRFLAGPWTFVLAGSGHIAGVVNHPDQRKYQFWTNPEARDSLDQFVAGAGEEPGSWWNHWRGWLETIDAATVPAKGKRVPGGRGDRVIEDAPGRYVAMR